jgi:hypothetical protein
MFGQAEWPEYFAPADAIGAMVPLENGECR